MAENDNFDFLRDGKALKNIREFQNIILTTKDNVKQLGADLKNATDNSADME